MAKNKKPNRAQRYDLSKAERDLEMAVVSFKSLLFDEEASVVDLELELSYLKENVKILDGIINMIKDGDPTIELTAQERMSVEALTRAYLDASPRKRLEIDYRGEVIDKSEYEIRLKELE